MRKSCNRRIRLLIGLTIALVAAASQAATFAPPKKPHSKSHHVTESASTQKKMARSRHSTRASAKAASATVDSIDMVDALHPQTLLAYGMNGGELPIAHGAPLRVRVERQLGYKSIKFLHRIRVTDEFYDPGKLGPLQQGWSWYTGI